MAGAIVVLATTFFAEITELKLGARA